MANILRVGGGSSKEPKVWECTVDVDTITEELKLYDNGVINDTYVESIGTAFPTIMEFSDMGTYARTYTTSSKPYSSLFFELKLKNEGNLPKVTNGVSKFRAKFKTTNFDSNSYVSYVERVKLNEYCYETNDGFLITDGVLLNETKVNKWEYTYTVYSKSYLWVYANNGKSPTQGSGTQKDNLILDVYEVSLIDDKKQLNIVGSKSLKENDILHFTVDPDDATNEIYVKGVKYVLDFTCSGEMYIQFTGTTFDICGTNVIIDGEKQGLKYISLEKIGDNWNSKSTLPYEFYQSSAVVNSEGRVEILGSGNSSYYSLNYERTGTLWTSKSTLPYTFVYGCALINTDGNLEMFGSGTSSSYSKYNYERVGTVWSSKSTLPYVFTWGGAIVNTDGNVEILGTSSGSSSLQKNNYERVGTVWTKKSTLPYNFLQGSTVVNSSGNVEVFGGNSSGCYSYNYERVGTTWSSKSTLPYEFYQGSAVVNSKGNVEILGCTNSTNSYKLQNYERIGTTWTSKSTLPYYFNQGSAIVNEDGNVEILGGQSGTKNNYEIVASYKIIGEN